MAPKLQKRRKAAVRTLRVVADCCGMDAPVFALRGLGFDVHHVAACDNDPMAKTLWNKHFTADKWHDDITTRDHEQCAAAARPVDLYVAGFPCQPFSMVGVHRGSLAAKGNGIAIFHCMRFIAAAKPALFLLENVEGLVTAHQNELAAILRNLKRLNNCMFNITAKIINSEDHGLPQNRKRLWILGARKDVDNGTFAWPEPFRAVNLDD